VAIRNDEYQIRYRRDRHPHRRRIREAVTSQVNIVNPLDGTPAGVIDVQFYDIDVSTETSVVFLEDGAVDRSPCGTGTRAKATLLFERGELDVSEAFENRSVIGTECEGQIMDTQERDGLRTVIPSVTGSAYVVSKNTYLFDPGDPLTGFTLRQWVFQRLSDVGLSTGAIPKRL
jgi:proline racemase